MKALVTGATGFSGRHLVERLQAEGIEVYGVSHRSEALSVRRIDVTSNAAWESVLRTVRPDFVFHLAGVAYAKTWTEFAAFNTLAAAALFDGVVAAGHSPRAILVVGSAAEYGIVPEAALPVSEGYSPSPRTAYGATKYAQTVLALEAAARGLRVIVARPTNIIGPGMPVGTALGSFARQLREIELGRHPPVLKVGNLTTSRDLLDARDVADLYVRLAKHESFAGIVNVGAGTQHEIRTVLDRLIDEFGVRVSIETDPARLRGVDIPRFVASTDRLTEVLGPRDTIPLARSLTDMVAHERAVTN
jgi:GDP-4-dehydro-6-deoxy-D-mannose reductase